MGQRHFRRKFVQKIGGQKRDQKLSGLVDGGREVVAVNETEVSEVVIVVEVHHFRPLPPFGFSLHLYTGMDQVPDDLSRAALLQAVQKQVWDELMERQGHSKSL